MFATTLALAAMTMNNPVAPAGMEVQELRTGCHPYRTKTPACGDDTAGKRGGVKEAQAMACHPDPVKSRICKSRERDAGTTLALRADRAAIAAN